MKITGGKIITEALKAEQVKFVIGIPGTHNIEMYDAMLDEPALKPILVTDEQSASFMGDGIARSSGELAAINVVPSAGLTHAMSGIAECYLDQIPLLVLVSGIRRDTGKSYQLHDIDQLAIVRPVAKKVYLPKDGRELYHAIREASHVARSAPCGPAVVEIPANLLLFNHEIPETALSIEHPSTAPRLSESQVKDAAQLLNRSKSVAIYVGLGAQGARSQILELAEKLDAIVFTTISGKGVFPEENARWAWNTIGRAAPPAIQKVERQTDCLLAIGCRFGEVATGSYGLEPPENLIHVDIDSDVFDRNYPAKVKVHADASEFCRAMLAPGLLSDRKSNSQHISLVEKLAAAHREVAEERASHFDSQTGRVSPARLMAEIQKLAGKDAVYVTDSGNGTFLAMEYLRLSNPRSFLGPVDYSCMGYCVPATVGAKLANPDRHVIALEGDGAFLMTGLELSTARAYGAGVMVFLFRDGELSQIAQFQKMSLNRQTCTEIPDYKAKGIADAVGIQYLSLATDSDVGEVVKKAFEISKKGEPVLVEVAVDYSVPTYFSKGVVKTNFLRFPWKDRLRLVSRIVGRKLSGAFSST